MEPLSLEDLIPTTGSFKLASTGKEYTLRPFTMADEIWLEKTYGGDGVIQKIFTDFDFLKIMRIAFNQLTDPQKEDFKVQSVKYIDDEGKEIEMTLGGYKLLYTLVAGFSEKLDVLKALTKTLGISRPAIEKMDEQIKAEEAEAKKKINSTGAQSSILSDQSTDGGQMISFDVPREKSVGA